MKKRAAQILLGVMVSSLLLTSCGKNDAREAANESALVEEEGKGERTEEGEKVEAEDTSSKEENAESPDAKSDDSQVQDGAEAVDEIEIKEESKGRIGILLSQESENAVTDAEELSDEILDGGYEPELRNALGDAQVQISQIQELIDQDICALIIDPVDPYGLTEILDIVSEKEIPIISYDKLIRNTAEVDYYVSYDTRAIGNDIGKQIVKKMNLEKAREQKVSYTIEFLMGSLDDNGALFLCNGILEILQEYLDDGTLVCRSGNADFDSSGILRWSNSAARSRFQNIVNEFYKEEKTPDIVCTAYDGFACVTADFLKDAGLVPGSEDWPMITGYGSEAEAVKAVAEHQISFTMFMDRKELAEGCVKILLDDLAGEKVEVTDYSQYDNGVKIVGAFTCGAQMIDKDNYQILVDNGTYMENEIRPDPTPSPMPTATPTPTVTPVPTAEPTQAMTPTPEATVTSTASSTQEAAATPTPASAVTSK